MHAHFALPWKELRTWCLRAMSMFRMGTANPVHQVSTMRTSKAACYRTRTTQTRSSFNTLVLDLVDLTQTALLVHVVAHWSI